MRLELFQMIDESLALLEQNTYFYEESVDALHQFFEELLSENEFEYVSLSHRIKSGDSLREKIIRNRLYKRHDSAQDLIAGLSDLVGIMISVRFIQDEEALYRIIKEHCLRKRIALPAQDGSTPTVRLDLDQPQPQRQKNGFLIYRIDGVYQNEDRTVHFELQIKSLVHLFWSEVEHKIIYKNNEYRMVDGYLEQMLGTIHDNLESIDTQLQLIHDQLQPEGENNLYQEEEEFFQKILAKMINEIFIRKLSDNIGFTIDFRNSCDVLSRYILEKNEMLTDAATTHSMIELMTRIKEVVDHEIDFEIPIRFQKEFKPKNRFHEILGPVLIREMNLDFEWNVFFHILFELEPDSDVEDFLTFLTLIRLQYTQKRLYQPLEERFSKMQLINIKEEIINGIAGAMATESTLRIISRDYVLRIQKRIHTLTLDIAKQCKNYDDWKFRGQSYLNRLEEDVIRILRNMD